MQFLKDNKLYIGLVVVAVMSWWVYMTFLSSGPEENTLLATPIASPLSQEVLTTLSNLTIIRLNPDIFTDPIFLSLTNYAVQIPPETAGRRNPFAPI